MQRLISPWTSREGWVLLLLFVFAITASSGLHMLLVKLTIGFKAYLGSGPRLPPSLLLIQQWSKAVVIVALLYWLALKRKGLEWSALGFRRCRWHWLLLAALLPLLALPLLVGLGKLLVVALPDFARFTASRYGWSDGPVWVMLPLLLTTMLVTPVVEEMLFRGFLFPWMASRRPLWLAAVASSAMFAASHLLPAQMIVAFMMSLAILWLFVRSGSLWPCIVCHVVNNSVGVLLGLAAVAGQLPPWLTPPG